MSVAWMRRVVAVVCLALPGAAAMAQSAIAIPPDFKSGFVYGAPGAAPKLYSLPEATPSAGDICKICMAPGSNKPTQCARILCAQPDAGAQVAVFTLPKPSRTRDFCLKTPTKGCIPLVTSFPPQKPFGPHGPGPDPGPWVKDSYRTSLDVFRLSAEDELKAGQLSKADFNKAMKAYKADSSLIGR